MYTDVYMIMLCIFECQRIVRVCMYVCSSILYGKYKKSRFRSGIRAKACFLEKQKLHTCFYCDFSIYVFREMCILA